MKNKLAISLLFFISSFSNAVDFATEGKKYDDLAGMNVNAVHIVSDSLQTQNKRLFSDDESVLSVEHLSSIRTDVETLMVTVMFRNRSSTAMTIEARTLFLGDAGMPIGDESGWQRIFIDSNGTATYREKSFKTNDVKHYRVEVRESK